MRMRIGWVAVKWVAVGAGLVALGLMIGLLVRG
jgi:hypothetical protein